MITVKLPSHTKINKKASIWW